MVRLVRLVPFLLISWGVGATEIWLLSPNDPSRGIDLLVGAFFYVMAIYIGFRVWEVKPKRFRDINDRDLAEGIFWLAFFLLVGFVLTFGVIMLFFFGTLDFFRGDVDFRAAYEQGFLFAVGILVLLLALFLMDNRGHVRHALAAWTQER